MSLSYYLNLSLAFLIMGGVLFLVLKFSKHLHAKKYTGDIQIKDRLPVDAGVTLLIVSVRGQDVLLSVANKSVTILKEFEDKQDGNYATH